MSKKNHENSINRHREDQSRGYSVRTVFSRRGISINNREHHSLPIDVNDIQVKPNKAEKKTIDGRVKSSTNIIYITFSAGVFALRQN